MSVLLKGTKRSPFLIPAEAGHVPGWAAKRAVYLHGGLNGHKISSLTSEQGLLG